MRVDDSRIRKEKVADSKISGYVWTGPNLIGRRKKNNRAARAACFLVQCFDVVYQTNDAVKFSYLRF